MCSGVSRLPATLVHMFWSCTKLCNFWKPISETFSRMCGVAAEPSPLISLFGVALLNVSLFLESYEYYGILGMRLCVVSTLTYQ